MIYPLGILSTMSPDKTMNLISLIKQKLCKIRSVLLSILIYSYVSDIFPVTYSLNIRMSVNHQKTVYTTCLKSARNSHVIIAP